MYETKDTVISRALRKWLTPIVETHTLECRCWRCRLYTCCTYKRRIK